MSRPQHCDQQVPSATIVELNVNPVVRDAGTNSIDARSKIEIVFEDRSWRFTDSMFSTSIRQRTTSICGGAVSNERICRAAIAFGLTTLSRGKDLSQALALGFLIRIR
jgi:hypothetical protein